METKIIKLLDSSLECIDCKIKNDKIILHVYSTKQKLICPYCGNASSKIHSVYQRDILSDCRQSPGHLLGIFVCFRGYKVSLNTDFIALFWYN